MLKSAAVVSAAVGLMSAQVGDLECREGRGGAEIGRGDGSAADEADLDGFGHDGTRCWRRRLGQCWGGGESADRVCDAKRTAATSSLARLAARPAASTVTSPLVAALSLYPASGR